MRQSFVRGTIAAMREPDDPRAITETVYRYATGVDTRDWALYRSIFADEVAIDFSSYDGQLAAGVMSADRWVARVRPLFTGLAATQHTMTNPIVELDDDAKHARCRMYMQAAHALDHGDDDAWFTIGGYYDDRLCREGPGHPWRIEAVRLTVLWRRGRAAIMALATARGLDAVASTGAANDRE